MEKKERLWFEEPPVGISATGWADAYETLVDLIANFIDGHGNVIVEHRIAVFALEDALQRCGVEAESQEPGILERRQQDNIDDLRASFEDL